MRESFCSKLCRTSGGEESEEGSMMRTVEARRVGDGMKLEQEVNLRDRRKTDFHLNLCFRRWFHPREIKYGACFEGHQATKSSFRLPPSARLFYAKMMLRVWFPKLSLPSFIDFTFFSWLLEPSWLPIYVSHHFSSPSNDVCTIRWSRRATCGITLRVDGPIENFWLWVSSQRNLPFNWILAGRVPARLRIETRGGRKLWLWLLFNVFFDKQPAN